MTKTSNPTASRRSVIPSTAPFALELLSDLPEHCFLVRERDGSSSPHIRKGECAVVDPTDRKPVSGQAFLVQWSNGSRSLVLVERRRDQITPPPSKKQPTWWLHPLAAQRNLDELRARIGRSEQIYLSEGPMADSKGFRRMIVGRVIGVYRPEASALPKAA